MTQIRAPVSSPTALGAPLGLEAADLGQIVGRQVAVGGADIVLKLGQVISAGDSAMDRRMAEHIPDGRLRQRLVRPNQEAELLDAPEPELELVAAWPSPLLLGRERLADRELTAQEAARQRHPHHDAGVGLRGQR